MSFITKNFPLVSIITPSYNQGDFIEETILSVKNQDYPNIEHIIVDGGSTDNTLDVLKKYEGTYNMRWISEPDEGQSDAINKGINMASGDIIAWLNSDDVYFFTHSVSEVVDFFRKDKTTDVVFGDLAYIDRKGKVFRIHAYREFNYKNLLQRRYELGQPAMFLRNYVLKENKLRKDLHYVLDYELLLRIGRKYIFKHLPDVLAGMRLYSESKTGTEMKSKHSKFKEEIKPLLAQYGYEESASLLNRFSNGIARGGYPILKGFLSLLRIKYAKKERKLAFGGGFARFPCDLIRQSFSKLLY